MANLRDLSSVSIGRGLTPFAALERSALFAGLGHKEVMDLTFTMRPRSFATGEEIAQAGSPAERVHVITSGLVRAVALPGRPGGAKRRMGEAIGAASVLTGEPHPETVVALMPTETLSLERDEFTALLERVPAIERNVARIVYRRFAHTLRREAGAGERGEAVALVVSEGLTGAIDAVVAAARSASALGVAVLDTREGLDAALEQVDGALADHGTVLLVARAEGRSAPLLGEHTDRVVALVERPGEVAGLDSGGAEPQLFVAGPATDAPGVVRTVARGDDAAAAGIPPADVAWLGRHLTRTKVGLALGAGGAKGFAHIGALAVLEEDGYTIDYVSGASIGAIVGTFIALGHGAGEIDTLLRETFSPEVVAEVFQISLAGTSTGLELLTRLLRETTGERTFDDVEIPLTLMSADLTNLRPAPLRDGTLWEALLAATALAGMFPPRERDGARLVDGVALVPVPTGALLEDGADVTVAVNLMSRDTLEAWPGEPDPEPEPDKIGSRFLATLLEVMDLMQLDESIRHAELADVTVTPRFGPSTWRDFDLADRFAASGRLAMEEQLPALRAIARPGAITATQTPGGQHG